jgi:hypothetical protein
LDSTCWVDIYNLCVPLFPCGGNQQPCLLFDLYNIYVDLERPMIWYQVVSQMSKAWIVVNFHRLLIPLLCNLLGISKPYALWSSNDKLQNSCLNQKLFSWGKCWQQFIVQHFIAPTLCIDSSNNTFSILEMEPS